MNSNRDEKESFTNLSILPAETLAQIFKNLEFADVKMLYKIYPEITLRSGILKDWFKNFKRIHLKISEILHNIKTELEYYQKIEEKSLKETNYLTCVVQQRLMKKTCENIIDLIENYETNYDSEYEFMEKFFLDRVYPHEEIREIFRGLYYRIIGL